MSAENSNGNINGSSATTTPAAAVNGGGGGYNHGWRKQLITKEDPQHVHKTLGVLVLLSYVYRLAHTGESDMAFATHPHWTVPTLLLHLTLNASSFIFHIPQRRIATGYRIWPEYRLHSLVFLCRSLAMMALFYAESTYPGWQSLVPQYSPHAANLVIILATVAAADLCSWSQGPHQSGFARQLDVPVLTQYFFSIAQFHATSMVLMGERRYTMQFLMVIIIQGNAFLMTLRRKNLAGHYTLITVYGLALAGAGVVAWFEYRRAGLATTRAVAAIGNVAVVLRTGPRIPGLRVVLQDNKYVLWIAMYGVLQYWVRPHLYDDSPESIRQSQLFFRTSTLALALLGAYKHYQSTQRPKEIKTV